MHTNALAKISLTRHTPWGISGSHFFLGEVYNELHGGNDVGLGYASGIFFVDNIETHHNVREVRYQKTIWA